MKGISTVGFGSVRSCGGEKLSKVATRREILGSRVGESERTSVGPEMLKRVEGEKTPFVTAAEATKIANLAC